MPLMPRLSKKSERIAYAILGKPANMTKSTPKQQELNRKLLWSTAQQFSK